VWDAKLLVLESDPWSVLELLFYHPLREYAISTAWTFLRNSAVALCLSACSCTDLMTQLLFHEISRMLEWTWSWDQPSGRLSMAVIENTNSELDLRRQWWRIWPTQHHLLLLKSQLIHISWGIV
jgi:hypothetical protein